MASRRSDQDGTQSMGPHVIGIAEDAEGRLRLNQGNAVRAWCRLLPQSHAATDHGKEASDPVLDSPTTHKCGLRFETCSTTPRRRVAWKSRDGSGRTTLPISKARVRPDSAPRVCSLKIRMVRR